MKSGIIKMRTLRQYNYNIIKQKRVLDQIRLEQNQSMYKQIKEQEIEANRNKEYIILKK